MMTFRESLNKRLQNPNFRKEYEAIQPEMNTIRERSTQIPLETKVPNADTIAAIEEGWRIAHDPNAKSYDSIAELRTDLDA